jgi:Protein of unknown function (DUF3592)
VEYTLNMGQPSRSRVGTKRLEPGCGIVFFGVFFLSGGLFGMGIVGGMVVPEWRANHKYLPNTCVVLGKRVASEYFDDQGTLHRPEIQIRYEVNGRKYEVWAYTAVNPYSSGSAGKDAIISQFRVGATYPCWYDPQHPGRAVLVRGYTWFPYVMLILPAAFLAGGGGGMYYFWTLRGKTAQQLALESALRSLGTWVRFDPDRPRVPAPEPSQRSGCTLAYHLRLGNPPSPRLFALVFIAIVWNALTVVPFVFVLFPSYFGGIAVTENATVMTLIFIPFCVVGLIFVYKAIKLALITFGVGPTTVEISLHPLVPGCRCEIFLSQTGRLRMNSLRVVCVCEEEAQYRDGTDTRTETRRVFEKEIIAKKSFEVHKGMPFEARGELRLPTGAMHSFVASHNQVRWKLVVRGDVAGWPDFENEYPLVVLPSPEIAK